MSWNYRVIRAQDGTLAIHEVYYDEAGKPRAYTEDPVAPMGETYWELLQDMKAYTWALREKILTPEDFPTPDPQP